MAAPSAFYLHGGIGKSKQKRLRCPFEVQGQQDGSADWWGARPARSAAGTKLRIYRLRRRFVVHVWAHRLLGAVVPARARVL
ncbi:hypothetical protein CN189_15650 [Sinorhizobium meliloti]|nr:hypothetical protein CN189_15650 [Sinorhizobium meliloti]